MIGKFVSSLFVSSVFPLFYSLRMEVVLQFYFIKVTSTMYDDIRSFIHFGGLQVLKIFKLIVILYVTRMEYTYFYFSFHIHIVCIHIHT